MLHSARTLCVLSYKCLDRGDEMEISFMKNEKSSSRTSAANLTHSQDNNREDTPALYAH
jgi:hypothetical protein